ncbi:MAG: phosphate--AMP phosphotransferase [Blastocatellia bacterium]
MLETVLDQTIAKETYDIIFPQLEARLSELQREARSKGIPVVVVFEGWDAAGKGTLINSLMQPLDPRGFKVWSINLPTQEELYHPFLWRFWTKLPARGAINIFDRSWYGRVLIDRVEKLIGKKAWKESYEEILNFERQLTDDGMVLVKFWIHIDKEEQYKRFKKIEKNPAESWKVTKQDWQQHKKYDDYLVAVEEMLARTSTPDASWTIVKNHDKRYGRIKIFQILIGAIEQAISLQEQNKFLAEAKQNLSQPEKTSYLPDVIVSDSVLKVIDLTKNLPKEEYQNQLKILQEKFRALEHEIHRYRIPVIITYEGWDAAGKGGNIKRLTENLDPRGYEVIPVAAPTSEEKAHHYLWRFWRNIPKAGHITIFDRTWYGRVLVERVEGFCKRHEWQRAYKEINEFERHLTSYGTVLVKFWLHIDPSEQLKRFQERQETPGKTWKITDEDWRNREKWAEYEKAICEMLRRTSTSYAPWTVVESVDKYYARIKVLQTVVDSIETALKEKRKK